MNKFLRTYLPAFSMAFTFIILYATISNIIAGYSKDRFCFFILQVFVYLMVSVIVDWLLSFIDFSKDNSELTLTLTTPDYMAKETAEKLNPFLRRPIVYHWKNGVFTK